MSMMTQVFLCAMALGLLAAGVLVWAVWPTTERIRVAAVRAVTRQRRGRSVVRVDPVATDPAGPTEEERTEDGEQPAEPEFEEPTWSNDPGWWGRPAAVEPQRWTADPEEPTPLFSAPGKHRYPDDLVQESFTDSWNRAELLDRIRRVEAQRAGVEAA